MTYFNAYYNAIVDNQENELVLAKVVSNIPVYFDRKKLQIALKQEPKDAITARTNKSQTRNIATERELGL